MATSFIAPLPCLSRATGRTTRTPRSHSHTLPRRRAAHVITTSTSTSSSTAIATTCSATPDGAASDPLPKVTLEREARLQLWREVEALKKSLQIAVNAERFSDAARLRDRIQVLSLSDDYFRTEQELSTAVAEQRFADAARLRDTLSKLEPPPTLSALRDESDRGTTTATATASSASQAASSPSGKASTGSSVSPSPTAASDTPRTFMADLQANDVQHWSITVTNGIRVRVDSFYMPEQSIPENNKFFFSYKVRIVNEGTDTCQLVSRHWIISSDAGKDSETKGSGVVGRQPVLAAGESFEYTSACHIDSALREGQCVVGSMKGVYHFCKGSTGQIRFAVSIDPFYLKLPYKHY